MPPTDDQVPTEVTLEAPAVLEAEEPELQPDPPFVQKYNAHYELPTGWALSVLVHLMLVMVLLWLISPNRHQNTKPVNISNLDGDDDSGAGAPGAGEANPDASSVPQEDIDRLIPQQELAPVKEDISKQLDLDPTQVPDSAIAALASLDDELRDKILNMNKRKGDGQAGTGIGGTGSDSTRARGMRWVLKFNTKSGQDYLAQLRAMKAVVMIPAPPENKKFIILRDLTNPKVTDIATDFDISQQADKIQFSDIRRDSCLVMQEVLRLRETPSSIIAFFPKDLEQTMARLETSYQNKKTEQIKETVFQVVVVGGDARLKVLRQTLK